MSLAIDFTTAIISALVSVPSSIIVFFISQNYSLAKNRNRLIKYVSGQIRVFSSNEDAINFISGRPTGGSIKTFRDLLIVIRGFKIGILTIILFVLLILADYFGTTATIIGFFGHLPQSSIL
ncbi:MAG: hypothetical protein QXZ17_07555 [Nitrososphaerota archaeon]